MFCVKGNDMIEQLPAQDSDCPLTNAVLPGAMISGFNGLDLGMGQKRLQILTYENAVIVVNKIFRLQPVRRCLSKLLGYPG